LLALGVALAIACSGPPANQRVVVSLPDRSTFGPVAQAFVHTCGTLDCHGAVGRNFKIYGNTGLRYDSNAVPSALTPTTSDEMDRTFESLTGLEPEVMSQVVLSGGQAPERLTFLRKARGTEAHKPGKIIDQGDDRDVCFTSWLSANVDVVACAKALTYP
jgi:hypothetical protein